MKLYRIYNDSINERAIDDVVASLRDGHAAIYPTDTMYAIGCDALNNNAINRICDIKGIDPCRADLSIICSSMSMAADYARIDNRAFRVMKKCLPGPFTFLLPAANTLPKVFKGRKVVGIRIPDNATARALAESLGHPIMTTSITYTDEDEAINPDAIAMHYDRDAAVMIDGGDGSTDVSTVVDLTDSSDPEIIRQGIGILP